jgi:hypothetical protein
MTGGTSTRRRPFSFLGLTIVYTKNTKKSIVFARKFVTFCPDRWAPEKVLQGDLW